LGGFARVLDNALDRLGVRTLVLAVPTRWPNTVRTSMAASFSDTL